MSFFARIAAFFLGLSVTFSSFPIRTISQRAKEFRVTAYVVGSNFVDETRIDSSHFADITDVILFGMATFDTEGKVNLDKNFDKVFNNLKNAVGESSAKIHLNLLGPGSVSGSTWDEQMANQGERHCLAFKNGKLEKNIKDVLDKYNFDGIFFDYEYPVREEHWKVFDEFLITFDKYIGDDYILGCAFSPWFDSQSPEAMAVLDRVEVMAYDLWDEDGTHSSIAAAEHLVELMIEMGYDARKLDMGIPFYARPTTQESYWYGYNGWHDVIDNKGLCFDEETGLTFSFNTYDVVYEKAQWAVMKGLGGVMVWHYSCDVPKENRDSLFNAIRNSVDNLAKYRIFANLKGKVC